jgi:hypothetical protein
MADNAGILLSGWHQLHRQLNPLPSDKEQQKEDEEASFLAVEMRRRSPSLQLMEGRRKVYSRQSDE